MHTYSCRNPDLKHRASTNFVVAADRSGMRQHNAAADRETDSYSLRFRGKERSEDIGSGGETRPCICDDDTNLVAINESPHPQIRL
jgi:hypothetical protein